MPPFGFVRLRLPLRQLRLEARQQGWAERLSFINSSPWLFQVWYSWRKSVWICRMENCRKATKMNMICLENAAFTNRPDDEGGYLVSVDHQKRASHSCIGPSKGNHLPIWQCQPPHLWQGTEEWNISNDPPPSRADNAKNPEDRKVKKRVMELWHEKKSPSLSRSLVRSSPALQICVNQSQFFYER